MTTSRTYLSIYLNDHHAGSAAGTSLAARAARSNSGTHFGAALERIAAEIEEDARSLVSLMARAGVKLNGRLRGYSPLSRLVELEGLSLGVEGKLSLWRALAEARPAAVEGLDLDRLIERAQHQREELERLRLEAARLALSEGGHERS